MNIHEIYINRCIELAKKGRGTTYPNPMVGSVVVCNGKIIGEGWHQQSGKPHAEVNAINAVLDKNMLSASWLYVNLEPCSHTGKTPPCAHYIIASGIRKVVVGMTDINEKVCGRGIQYLRDHGCEVIVDVLKEQCELLNKRFLTYHLKKRPFVILKWAKTADGYIDKDRSLSHPVGPNWITNKIARQFTHKMRSEEEAILVGTNTVINDDPSLTVRKWSGSNPTRVVIDRDLKIPLSYNVFRQPGRTLVFTSKTKSSTTARVEYVYADFNKEIIPQILHQLWLKNIQSLIVEGGAHVLKQFINLNVWDEIYEFKGEVYFNSGLEAPDFTGKLTNEFKFEDSQLRIYTNY